MTARCIVSGVLHKEPASKIAKNGNTYALATIREGAGDSTRWWKAIAFSESAVETILSLQDGSPIAVSGEFSAEVWSGGGGDPRINWRITVDAVQTTKAPRKTTGEREKRQEPERGAPKRTGTRPIDPAAVTRHLEAQSHSSSAHQSWENEGGPNDSIPF